MSKNIVDRLFEINYFSAITEALEKYNLSENGKHLKKLMSDKADIKLVNARFYLQELYSQMFNEAFEHLNKINDIFNLINKSLFSDVKKEKLKNTVIDIIDKKFTDFADVKFKSIDELSNYSYGYRRGLLDNLYNIINSQKENQYYKITDEIYKNLSHDKLIKGKTVFTRLIIDNNLSNEYDIVKITDHIKNKIDEINNLKTCFYGENLQSFKSGLSEKKLEKLHNKLINADFIASETDFKAFCKVFSAEPLNNSIVPVKWIKKATRNKQPAKKALIELLILLNVPKSEYEDKTILKMCFTDGSNKPLIFTGSNFYNNKDIKTSEFYSEIQTIVKSL